MSKLMLVLWLVIAFQGQEHPAPPEGWFCQPPGRDVPADHACSCQRKCVKNQSCDEEGADCQDAPGTHMVEDSKCKVYCHKDHCGCPTGCHET